MTSDEKTTALLVVGGGALVAGLAWLVWPRSAAAATLAAPVPVPNAPTPSTHSYAPQMEPPVAVSNSFLASAPPAGPSRERYFEAAVEAPQWSEVVLSPAVKIRVSSDVVKGGGGVRLPLWPSTAQRVADRFGAMLPTKKLSDAIWRAAAVKLTPRSMTPRAGASRDSNRLLAEHEQLVNTQLAGRTGLIAAAKKDVIVGAAIPTHPDAVYIYGWHRSNGQPVQPVFGGHSSRYSDYSHGARLVSRTAYLNGQPVEIESLFANPAYASLLNESGTLTPAQLRYRTT
jgi:hypothetical protein